MSHLEAIEEMKLLFLWITGLGHLNGTLKPMMLGLIFLAYLHIVQISERLALLALSFRFDISFMFVIFAAFV